MPLKVSVVPSVTFGDGLHGQRFPFPTGLNSARFLFGTANSTVIPMVLSRSRRLSSLR